MTSHSNTTIPTLITAVILLLCGTLTATADPSAPPAAEQLARATAAYEQAIEARAIGNEAQARSGFNAAATLYEDLLTINPNSADLRRNLALAHINAGRLGQGIAELRSARAIAPYNPSLRATINADLAAARARVLTQPNPTPPEPPLAFTHPLAKPAILWTAIAILTLGWLLVLARILRPLYKPGPKPIPLPGYPAAATTIALGMLALAAPLTALWSIQQANIDHAVIIADETIARTGPSETGFPPAFEQPLTQGVELTVTERRATWLAIKLNNTQQAWIPANTVEFITQTP